MPENKNNNLIVYVNPDPNDKNNPNGGCYSIPPEVYTSTAYKMDAVTAATAMVLLSDGTVVANIPDDHTGLGGWCFLINLPALNPPPVNVGDLKKQKPNLTAEQLVRAMKGLLSKVATPAPGSKEAEISDAVDALAKRFDR